MVKVLRVTNDTFESLIRTAKWSETMDQIICKLVAEYNRTYSSTKRNPANGHIKNIKTNSQDSSSATQSCEQAKVNM